MSNSDEGDAPAVPVTKAGRRDGRLGTGVAALALLLFFGPALVVHVRLAATPTILNDDARQQIWPLFRLLDRDLFAGDLIADYYLDCMPGGYRFLYAAMGRAVDPRTVSRVLPYVLMLVVAVGLSLAAHRIAGRFGALVVLLSVMGSAAYLDRMTGGLPRAFGYPFAAVLILLLVSGRPVAFAAAAVLSVAFYPTVAVVGGIVLAAWMALPRVFGLPGAWPWWKRAALVVSSAVLMVAIHAPVLRSCSAYGPALSESDVGRFPELGPKGRYLPEDRPPFRTPARWFVSSAASALKTDSFLYGLRTYAWGELVVLTLLGAGAIGALLGARAETDLRRLWLVPAAAAGAYVAAAALYPALYIPTRYPTVVMPLLAPLLTAAGLRWMIARARSAAARKRLSSLALVAIAGVSLLSPARSVASAGWNVRITPRDAGLFEFLRTLPRDALIAGWPGPGEPIDSTPYVALRPVLISWETHQAFHERYALEMRRRMEALIDLYIDADAGASTRLAEEFGVSHLIVGTSRAWLAGLGYMEPVGSSIRARPRRATMEDLRNALRRERVVYQDRSWVVLEISSYPRTEP